MQRFRPLAVTAAWLTAILPGAAKADALTQWLDGVASCTAARTVSLAIIGVDARQTALSQEQAEEARLYVEQRLQASGKVRIAPAADVVRIKALREGTTGLSGQQAEEQIRKAFEGDAAVFFASPARNGDKAVFRLQAIARSADCKVTSEPIEVAIRVGPGLSDIDQVMQGAVRNLTQLAPDMKSVEICPIASAAGFSTCSAALGDRLTIALDSEARSATRVLRQQPLDVRKAGAGQCGTGDGDVTAHGSFEHDRNNQSWMSLEFRRNGTVLAPTGRTRIAVDALGCDPTVRPFLDHVSETAKRDRDRLDMLAAASPFGKGQRLDMRIEAKAQMRLYCWVLAPDETGFVTLPVRGEEEKSRVAAGSKSYPLGFGLADIVLDQPFENLFHCFGIEGDLPAALRERWLSAAPSATAEAKLLPRAEVLDLLEQIRATPGVTEAAARIIVR